MGTHPIFESDFDCLTEGCKIIEMEQERVKSITGRVIQDGEKLNPANEFKILLATDIHLGHKYDIIIRSNDTFDTFDEILEIAKKEKVDFVLLGGDLFDVNEPNIGIMNQAIAILSKASLQTRCLIGGQDSALI